MFAAAMMIPQAGAFSMWYDEVNFLANALTLNFEEFYNTERAVYAVHPPLYFIVLKAWSLVAGEADLGFRMLSVFWALLAVALVYRLAADMAGRSAGLVAGMLLGGMGFLEVYAQTVHNYTFFMMLCVVLFFFYWRWWFVDAATVYWAGAVITTVALLYTHYYSVYILLALNGHALWYWRDRRYRRWLGGQVLAAIVYVPWLPVVIRLAGGDYDRFGEAAVQDAVALTSDLSGIEHIIRFQLYDTPLAYGVLLLLGIGAWLMNPAAQGKRVWAWLALTLILSLAAAMLGNLVLKSLLPRRVLYLMPLVVLAIAYGLSRLPKHGALMTLAAFLVITWNAPPPDEWVGDLYFRQSIESIQAQAEPQDMAWIYFSGDLEALPLDYYAERILSIPYVMQSGDPVQLDGMTWARDRIWVLWSGDAPILTDSMQARGYAVSETMPSGWMQLSRLDAPPLVSDTLADPMDANLPQTFGEIFILEAVALAETDNMLTITLDWQALQTPPANLVVYVHLLRDGELIAQGDAVPQIAGRELPTQFWATDTLYRDVHTLTIPAAGDYTLKIGWYDPTTNSRLLTDSGDGIELGLP